MGPDGRPREFRSYSLFRIRLIVYRTTRLDSGTSRKPTVPDLTALPWCMESDGGGGTAEAP